MKRPWQIWLVFSLCLAIVLPAMSWLSVKALELDRAEALARRQAELEEQISRALWRMDARLTPVLAQEAARPESLYRCFLPSSANATRSTASESTPSPLLAQPSDFVLLNFQLNPRNQLSSPQCPRDDDYTQAVACGIPTDRLQTNIQRFTELTPLLDYHKLLERLPEQTLPSTAATSAWLSNTSRGAAPPPQVVNSLADTSQLQQQISAPNDDVNLNNSDQRSPVASGENPFANNTGRMQARAGKDIQNRAAAFQTYAQQSLVEQRSARPEPQPQTIVVREGVSQALWVDANLLLARRVSIGDQIVIQGCWLDWPKLRDMLAEEVADLLPLVTLEAIGPASEIRLNRLLVTLPVQLGVPAPLVVPGPFSPIRVSLGVAWLCLVITAVAVAGLLWGVMRLSERRAAFVSAVTHELRTPLTTFRMYSEMLADGMVPDEQQRQSYLHTLRTEADRLAHLVENVLQYARLERGARGRTRERLTVAPFLERVEPRLRDRAAEAGLKWKRILENGVGEVTFESDPTAIEQVLFNLVDNASKYAAGAPGRPIELRATLHDDALQLRVRDEGPGISAKAARRLFRPFSKSVDEAAHSAPGVGLGLALCHRLARDLGGRLEFESNSGPGASFVLTIPVG